MHAFKELAGETLGNCDPSMFTDREAETDTASDDQKLGNINKTNVYTIATLFVRLFTGRCMCFHVKN